MTSNVHSTSTRSLTRSKTLTKTKMNFNLIKRIFKGIGKAIIGTNQALRNKFFSMLGCMKQTDKPTTTKDIQGSAYKFFDKTVDGLVVGLKWILSAPRAIFGYICKYKKNVVQYISSLFAQKKLRKYRRMVESGKSLSLAQLKKYRSAWSFLGAIKSVGNVAIGAFKYVGGKLWNLAMKVIMPFLRKHWVTVKNAMIALRDSFFGKNSLIGKMVACSNTLSSKVIDTIKKFFGKIKERYDRYKGIYGLGLPWVALYGGDMIFTAICDANISKELKQTAEKIQGAEKKRDQKGEVIAGGKLFGQLMKFSTTFKSDFSAKIDAAIQASKDKHNVV